MSSDNGNVSSNKRRIMPTDNGNIHSKEHTMDIEHLPKRSGVYKITNCENGFVYIGSAGKMGIYKRFIQHRLDLRKHKHHSWILQQDWDKYGEDKFKAEVIMVCSPLDSKKIEQELINAQGVGRDNKSYNILDKVDHSSLPKGTIEKIKTAHRNPNLIISTNKSGYKGVCFYKREQKWKASIQRYGHSYHIGYYQTPEEASEAYQKLNILSDEDFERWWKNEYETKRKYGKYVLKGEKAPNAKLTNCQAQKIIDLYKTNEYTQKELGNLFNIDPSQISRIITGKRYFM